MRRQSGADDDVLSPGPHSTPRTASSVRRSLSRTLAVSSGIVTGIVKRLSSTATTIMSSANSEDPEWREEDDWNASVESSSRRARQKDVPDRSADVDRASYSGAVAYRTVARSGEGKTFGDASSTLSPNCYRRETVVASENMNLTVSKSTLLRPTPNKISQLLPQFRKETSCASRSHSESVASPLNYSILPPYISPFGGRIGDMPAVRLSPRISPRPLKPEDRARPVTVKISQPDPLKTPFQRCRSLIGDPEQSQSYSYCRTSSVETVVEALRKRKHSGIDIQEFDVDDGIETRILEDAQQPLKKRCSRDSLTRVESLFNDSTTTGSSETNLSRGMKRPALHGDLDVNLPTGSPSSSGTAFEKACQKSSPAQSPLRRYACGAKNLIAASYSSIQRFEKRLRSENSCQSSILHDKSMLSSGSRMTSRQTSPASSRVSWNSSQVNRGGLGSTAVPSSGPSSRCASPSTALDKSQEPGFGLSQRLLVKDGSRKNRLTVLSPCSAAETRSNSEEAQANAVLFTADDLERDRLLLSNRANWMLSEVGLADATSGITSQKASADVAVTSATPSEVGKLSVPSVASDASSAVTSVGLFGQNMTTISKAVDTLTNPSHVTGKDAVIESCVLKLSSTTVPLSDVLTSSTTCSSVTSNSSDNSSLAISSSMGILVPSDKLVSTTCANLLSNSSEPLKSGVVDFNAGASTKLGGGDGLSDVLDTSSQVSQSSLGSFVSVATVSSLTTFSTPLVSSSSDSSASMTFTFSKDFASSSTTAAGSVTTQKEFGSDGTKDPLTAASLVFGTQNSSLSASRNDVLTSGTDATERTVSAGTFANAKSEKVGLEFANRIADLTPGSISTGANVASASVSSSSLQTVTSGKFAFGNPGGTQTAGIKFDSLATAQATTRGSFGANSAVANTFGGGLGSAAVKKNVASGGFAFGDSGSAAATAQSAFSSGGFAFGSAAASQPVTSEKTQNASNCAFPLANSNIILTSANRLGNSAPVQSTAGGGGGFAFGVSTTTQSSCFGQLGMMQTTLSNSSGSGFSGATQSSGSNNIFGNSTVTQSSGGFTFEKSVTSQTTTNSGFVFGTSATIQANGSMSGNAVNTSTNNSGLSTSMYTKLPAITFSKSGVAKPQGSGLSSSSDTGTFVFGKSAAPSTATSHANTNFGGLNSINAIGSNVMPNSTFSTTPASSVSFSNSFASVNANNQVNSTSFGSGFSAVSHFGTNLGSSTTFGTNLGSSTAFGTNLGSSTAFGTNPSKGVQLSSVASNIGPFDNKPFGSNPNVANSMGGVNQSAAVPAFGASGAPAGNQFPQLFSGDGCTADRPAPVFNFMGTKSGSVAAVSSSEKFVFGKTASPFPTFSQNTGGFAFNHSSGNNLPSSSSNQGFNFQAAVQAAVNSQPSTREFNFSAFGQTQDIGTNGIPGPVPSFGASGTMPPSFSLGMSTPTARANRGRKKAGR